MTTNINRPTIGYENIAMFQSLSPAHSGINNSGNNLSFLPFVQSLDFSFDIPATNVGNLGAKSFADQSSPIQPNVNLSVNTLETFQDLFSGLFSGSGIKENLNTDTNFYAVLGDKKNFDVSKINLSGAEVLSFGNCFLNDATISQSINGLMTSQYSYISSNVEVQKLEKFQLPENPDSVTSFTVDGSTENGMNGVYNHNGTLNGKKRWQLDANTEIVWNNSNNRWELRFFGSSVFSAGQDTTYPWDATDWSEDGGTVGDIGFSIPQIFYTGAAPSVNLIGAQLKDEKVQFRPLSTGPFYYSTPKNAEDLGDYYSKSLSPDEQGGIIRRVPLHDKEKIIPYYKTNLIISNPDLIAQSDNIQEFNIQMPINRKTIYGLGKKFPVTRKALFPNECVINISNLLSNFELSQNRYFGYSTKSDYPIVGSSLRSSLNFNQSYNLNLNGTNNAGVNFDFKIQNAKLINQSYNLTIGSDFAVDLSFSFELNSFSAFSLNSVSSFAIENLSYSNASDFTTFTLTAQQDGRPLYSFSRGSPFNDSGEIRWSDSSVHWLFRYYPSLGTPTNTELFPSESKTSRNTPYPYLDINNNIRTGFSNLF